MTRAAFTQATLARAVKVAKEHGMAVEVLTDGTIRLLPVNGERAQPDPDKGEESRCDEVFNCGT